MSTQKQGEGVSLEAQRDAIAAFASQHDLRVTQWFEEKETAAKSGRPIFNQMLRQLKQGKSAGLIMHKIDRSARNLRDWALVSELPSQGIDIYFATESLDFKSRGGRLAANLQAVIAEDYIFNLREETIKGMRGRLKQGLYPWAAPPGYLDQGGGKPKVPCPKTAPLIRELFECYASGQYSYTALLAHINRRGLRSRSGGALTLCGLGNILQNPFYVGMIRLKTTGETFKGIHEPLITLHTWKQVQKVRTRRSGPKITQHNHVFRGLFRCGLCGAPMVPELQKGTVYYRCKPVNCETKTIREDQLEKAILEDLKRLRLRASTTREVNARTLQEAAIAQQEQRTSLELQIADDAKRLLRLEDLLIDDKIPIETYNRKKDEIQLRLAHLREQLETVPDPEALCVAQTKLAELRNNLVYLYEMANPAERRLIIENVWPNRRVTRRDVELEPHNWVVRDEICPSLLGGAPQRDRGRTIIELFDVLSDANSKTELNGKGLHSVRHLSSKGISKSAVRDEHF